MASTDQRVRLRDGATKTERARVCSRFNAVIQEDPCIDESRTISWLSGVSAVPGSGIRTNPEHLQSFLSQSLRALVVCEVVSSAGAITKDRSFASQPIFRQHCVLGCDFCARNTAHANVRLGATGLAANC
jgi:hypothetical protein